MKALLFGVAAMLFYAIANVILERKLARISPLASTTCLYVGLLAFSVPPILLRDHFKLELTMPEASHFWLLVLCGVLFFAADLSYFNAYKLGAKIEQLAVTSLFYPVIVMTIKAMVGGNLPTKSDFLSWALAGTAIVIAARQSLN